MNGPARKIEILAPFNQAIELTRSILFRPFDITKWLVIGFAAFLSGWLNSGGGSINPWSFRGWNTSNAQSPTFQFRSFNVDHAGVFVLVVIVVLIIVFFRSEEHTSELQSQSNLVCRLLLGKKKI